MEFNLKIRELAAEEIIQAYHWYESKQQGLGNVFLAALEEILSTIVENPNTFSFYCESVREGKLKKFPYTVVYEVFETEIIVYSVFMTFRDPDTKSTY